MEIRMTQKATCAIYALTGRFDAHQVQKVQQAVEPIQGSIKIDLTDVAFIDSSGLSTLVRFYRQAKLKGYDFAIVNVPDTVRLIFEVTQLQDVLPIEPAITS